mmetsp:Transcript_31475/g.83906  ORF Transcript_31475/g.83906 Transcript_31475/m.83906 type:complete len:214 (+) Transcript_31475:1107-1748(+)
MGRDLGEIHVSRLVVAVGTRGLGHVSQARHADGLFTARTHVAQLPSVAGTHETTTTSASMHVRLPHVHLNEPHSRSNCVEALRNVLLHSVKASLEILHVKQRQVVHVIVGDGFSKPLVIQSLGCTETRLPPRIQQPPGKRLSSLRRTLSVNSSNLTSTFEQSREPTHIPQRHITTDDPVMNELPRPIHERVFVGQQKHHAHAKRPHVNLVVVS